MNKIVICSYDEKLIPTKMTSWAVCYDMFIEEKFEINPWEVVKVPTWIKTYLPIWWQVKVYARSSLPTKTWLMLANSVAVIDADYRWNYIMQFYNFTDKKLVFEKYSRLTQMEFLPYYVGSWIYWTKEIPELEIVVNKELYDNFENEFNSERWIGCLWSTGV
jgi:dUTPase